jgi:hypothetical protein
MSSDERLKRCSHPKHEGERWLPATTKHFYATTSRGKRVNQYGEPFLRSACRVCKLREHREWSISSRPKKSPEERQRLQRMQRARARAYQRLAAMNPEGFKLLYAEELRKEDITLAHYVGPSPRAKRKGSPT